MGLSGAHCSRLKAISAASGAHRERAAAQKASALRGHAQQRQKSVYF
jgi:hypothetical protein